MTAVLTPETLARLKELEAHARALGESLSTIEKLTEVARAAQDLAETFERPTSIMGGESFELSVSDVSKLRAALSAPEVKAVLP